MDACTSLIVVVGLGLVACAYLVLVLLYTPPTQSPRGDGQRRTATPLLYNLAQINDEGRDCSSRNMTPTPARLRLLGSAALMTTRDDGTVQVEIGFAQAECYAAAFALSSAPVIILTALALGCPRRWHVISSLETIENTNLVDGGERSPPMIRKEAIFLTQMYSAFLKMMNPGMAPIVSSAIATIECRGSRGGRTKLEWAARTARKTARLLGPLNLLSSYKEEPY